MFALRNVGRIVPVMQMLKFLISRYGGFLVVTIGVFGWVAYPHAGWNYVAMAGCLVVIFRWIYSGAPEKIIHYYASELERPAAAPPAAGPDWNQRHERFRRVLVAPFRILRRWLASKSAVLTLIVLAIIGSGVWFATVLDARLGAVEHALGGRDALGCDTPRIIDRVTSSVVRIIGGFGEGTGFAVSEHYILTNHHVIDGEPSPKVVFTDGSFENGVVVAADADKDLAVIRVGRHLDPLQWDSYGGAQIGQTILEFGYPYGGNLNGQATVNRASISAFRGGSNDAATYVQTNGGLIEGMSGGPMTNLCGNVVAVNTSGGENLGLGIDEQTASDYVFKATLGGPTEPWQKPTQIDPDASPEDAVTAYYGYISARNYEAAFAMLSPHFIGSVSYADWVAGFETQLQTAVMDINPDKYDRRRVLVNLESTDLVGGEIAYRQFEGSWLVVRENGHLRLWESNIKEITGNE